MNSNFHRFVDHWCSWREITEKSNNRKPLNLCRHYNWENPCVKSRNLWCFIVFFILEQILWVRSATWRRCYALLIWNTEYKDGSTQLVINLSLVLTYGGEAGLFKKWHGPIAVLMIHLASLLHFLVMQDTDSNRSLRVTIYKLINKDVTSVRWHLQCPCCCCSIQNITGVCLMQTKRWRHLCLVAKFVWRLKKKKPLDI